MIIDDTTFISFLIMNIVSALVIGFSIGYVVGYNKCLNACSEDIQDLKKGYLNLQKLIGEKTIKK